MHAHIKNRDTLTEGQLHIIKYTHDCTCCCISMYGRELVILPSLTSTTSCYRCVKLRLGYCRWYTPSTGQPLCYHDLLTNSLEKILSLLDCMELSIATVTKLYLVCSSSKNKPKLSQVCSCVTHLRCWDSCMASGTQLPVSYDWADKWHDIFWINNLQ